MEQSNKNKKAHLAYVRGLLRMYGIRNRQIAKSLGVTDSAIGHVLAGRKKSLRVQQAVADALNKSFEELWEESA